VAALMSAFGFSFAVTHPCLRTSATIQHTEPIAMR
jgi:hypothetical protein